MKGPFSSPLQARKGKEKKIDHEGGFQGALLLQSTTKEGKFMADQVESGIHCDWAVTRTFHTPYLPCDSGL